MQKNVISSKQAICVLIMFIFGNTLMYSGSKAKQDTWIVILAALAMAVPLVAIYARIVKSHPGQGLYDVIVDVFGRVFGRLIVLLYVLYAIYLGALLIRSFAGFIHVVAMPETPLLVIALFLFLLSGWMIKSGVETLGRWARVALPVVIVSVAVTLLISVKSMDFKNIMPVAATGFKQLTGSALSVFASPFAETILFAVLFNSVKENSSPLRIYFMGIFFSSLIFLVAAVRNILVLGFPTLDMYYFSSYTAVSVISLGEFFSRIEVLIGLAFLLDLFVKLCVCMFAVAMGFSKLAGLPDHKSMAFPAGLLMMALAAILFTNTVEMFEWLNIYKYFALPFEVVLPLMIFIAAEFKNRTGKRAGLDSGGIS
jgi:spore germination protein KB